MSATEKVTFIASYNGFGREPIVTNDPSSVSFVISLSLLQNSFNTLRVPLLAPCFPSHP